MASMHAERTEALAVMFDTDRPLHVTKQVVDFDASGVSLQLAQQSRCARRSADWAERSGVTYSSSSRGLRRGEISSKIPTSVTNARKACVSPQGPCGFSHGMSLTTSAVSGSQVPASPCPAGGGPDPPLAAANPVAAANRAGLGSAVTAGVSAVAGGGACNVSAGMLGRLSAMAPSGGLPGGEAGSALGSLRLVSGCPANSVFAGAEAAEGSPGVASARNCRNRPT